MIAAIRKAWLKWCIAVTNERQARLESNYRYESQMNARDLTLLNEKLESVNNGMARKSIKLGKI